MTRDIKASIIGAIVFTLLIGVVYPLAMTGLSQALFHDAATGSTIKLHGRVVGSTHIAQAFDQPVLDRKGRPKQDADGNELREPDPDYFQPRPSQTGYAADASGFLNQGPNQQDLADTFAANLTSYMDLEGKYDSGLKRTDVPVDAVANSASGIDPHISIANARIQAHRIAAERNASLAHIRKLIDQHTDGRFLGLFGEPGVNVLELNLALDKEYPKR